MGVNILTLRRMKLYILTRKSSKYPLFDKLLPRFHLFILRNLICLFNETRLCGIIHLNYCLIQILSSLISPEFRGDFFNITISLAMRFLNSLSILLINKEKKQIKRLVCGIINRHDCNLYDYDVYFDESYALTFCFTIFIYSLLFLKHLVNLDVLHIITIYGEFSVTICHLFYLQLIISLHSYKRQTFSLAQSDKYNLSQIDATVNHLSEMNHLLNNIFLSINRTISLQIIIKIIYCLVNHATFNVLPIFFAIIVSLLNFYFQMMVRYYDIILANAFVLSFSSSQQLNQQTIAKVQHVFQTPVTITGVPYLKKLSDTLLSLSPRWWFFLLCIHGLAAFAILLVYQSIEQIAQSGFTVSDDQSYW